jgi:hypothetical protein
MIQPVLPLQESIDPVVAESAATAESATAESATAESAAEPLDKEWYPRYQPT